MTSPAQPSMTPERWRAVDQILQGALTCARGQRDEFIAASCGDDTSLRTEVSSLLAAYDAAPADFLERSAIEEHVRGSAAAPAEPSAPPASRPQPKRMVSARLALYVAAAGIVVSAVTGWNLAQSATVERWRAKLRTLQQTNASRAASTAPSTGVIEGDGELALVVVDRNGRVVSDIAANRPWTPRFSPDGKRIAYGAYGQGRGTSDIWITDLAGGTTRRLTDDDADNNDPQWSPDGGTIAYSVDAEGGKDIARQSVGGGRSRIVAARPGRQFPTDWLRDGSALLVSEDAGSNDFDIQVQPTDGSPAHPYAATSAHEIAGRMSPREGWVAYTSNESGRDEVYVDSYPQRGYRVMVSRSGGIDPVWRGDGRELYYWRGDMLIAVPIDGSHSTRPPIVGAERMLFHSAYEHSLIAMYDVSPDGERIVIVRHR